MLDCNCYTWTFLYRKLMSALQMYLKWFSLFVIHAGLPLHRERWRINANSKLHYLTDPRAEDLPSGGEMYHYWRENLSCLQEENRKQVWSLYSALNGLTFIKDWHPNLVKLSLKSRDPSQQIILFIMYPVDLGISTNSSNMGFHVSLVPF